MDKNVSIVWQNLNDMFFGFVALLPNIVIGLIVFILFFLLGKLFKRVIKRVFQTRKKNLGLVVSRLINWVVNLLGAFVALIIIVPTFEMGDFIAGLGIGSVAIGFAFKDVLQNFLSGILILLTEPFKVGDEIIVNNSEYEGSVIQIETRATHIMTYDGRLVIIPNISLYTGSVIVNTAFAKRRTAYTIGIGVNEDPMGAIQIILDAVNSVDEVLDVPRPDVLISELGEYTINLTVRWWTESSRSDLTQIKSHVLAAINQALADKGVDMPFPTQNVHCYDHKTK